MNRLRKLSRRNAIVALPIAVLLAVPALGNMGWHAFGHNVLPSDQQCVSVHCYCDPWDVNHPCDWSADRCRQYCEGRSGSNSDDAYGQLGAAIGNLLGRAVRSLFSRRKSSSESGAAPVDIVPTPVARPNPEYTKALDWLRTHQLPPDRAQALLEQVIHSQQNTIASYETSDIRQQLALAACLAEAAARPQRGQDAHPGFEDAQFLLYQSGQALQGGYVLGPLSCRPMDLQQDPKVFAEKYALLVAKTRTWFERVAQKEREIDDTRTQIADAKTAVQQWEKKVEELKTKLNVQQSAEEKQVAESVLQEALKSYDQAVKSRAEVEDAVTRLKSEHLGLMTQAQTAVGRLDAAAKDPSELDKALAAFDK